MSLGSGKQSWGETFDSSMGSLIFIICVPQRSPLKQERIGGFWSLEGVGLRKTADRQEA